MAEPSRLLLYFRASIIRSITFIFSFLDRRYSIPVPRASKFSIKIPSTLSKRHGFIPLEFYAPDSYTKSGASTRGASYPVVLNFHGGGFVFGSAASDARWAHLLTEAGFVCVGVNYRLAPEYPYPTAVEDGADAILWLSKHADEYGLDISKIALSGFSAGGNLVFTSAIKLLSDAKADLKLRGIISIYPLVDRTQSRENRAKSNPISASKRTLPASWYRVFDDSYVFPLPEDFASPYLSPALAPEELLQALPQNIVLFSCGWDDLLEETETFRRRLLSLGKNVSGGIVEDVPHAWDKAPTFKKGDKKRDLMYSEAISELKKMCL